MPKKKHKPKAPRWKTIRCVVEYRTPRELSERELSAQVQSLLDSVQRGGDSKLRVKSFKAVAARELKACPHRLCTANRVLERVVKRLRKL